MMKKLNDIVTDVSVREGSQQKIDLLGLSIADKIEVARLSAKVGIKIHELTAFAPGAWFSEAEELANKAASLPSELVLRALYFNAKGYETLLKYPRFEREVIFHTAVTKGYREKNYRQMSIDDVKEKFSKLIAVLSNNNRHVDTLVLSTVWGEAGEAVTEEALLSYIEMLMLHAASNSITVHSLTLCDTEGQANAKDIYEIVSAVRKNYPKCALRMHLHPPKEKTVEVIHAALDAGADYWEASWCGMGGSPFADQGGGNLDIRYLIKVWNERHADHGLNESAVLDLVSYVRSKIQRPVEEIKLS